MSEVNSKRNLQGMQINYEKHTTLCNAIITQEIDNYLLIQNLMNTGYIKQGHSPNNKCLKLIKNKIIQWNVTHHTEDMSTDVN